VQSRALWRHYCVALTSIVAREAPLFAANDLRCRR
jgi:hypothetical protein